MKTIRFGHWLGLGSLFCLGLCAAAQNPTPGSPTNSAPPIRRPGNMPLRSPEIGADRTVTFRIRAPKASQVVLNGQWPQGRVPMVAGTNGVWSVTTGPIDPGVWEYSFIVDDVAMIDPANPALKPMREPRTSILHLPSTPPAAYDYQDVPHGTVHVQSYWSKPLGRLRSMEVYTPPGYENRTSKSYPVLYLQHGSGDNQSTWVAHGQAHWILDNLIARKRAVPMIVVMLDGHAAIPGTPGGGDNTSLFERDLLEAALPLVESTYRTKTGARNRAIVGLSMGGGQSLSIGLNHTEDFAWVGGFSAAPPSADAVAVPLKESARTNQRLKLLWIAVGQDDFLRERNEQFIATLKSSGIRYDWKLTPGNHSWPVWRDYLTEFLPLLFR